MRKPFIAFFFFWLCSPLSGGAPDTIAPGISLTAAKATLQKHGYEVNTRKYGLAMDSDDRNNRLEFCRIDKNVTLVIEYRTSTELVVSLGVVFTPDNPKSKLDQVYRNTLEIAFENGGIYSLKLKRVAMQANESR